VLTSAGKNLASITVNGAGGTTQLADDLTATAVQNAILTVTAGILNANGKAMTLGLFNSSGSTARTIQLGGLVKIGNNVASGQVLWNFTTVTNLTFTKGSADLEVVVPAAGVQQAGAFLGGGQSFNALIFDNTTNQTFLNMTGSSNFTTWTVGSGWFLQLPSPGTQALSSTLTVNGTSAHWSALQSAGANATTTITSVGGCVATYTVLFAVVGSAGCQASGVDLGFNTNWTITSPTGAGGGGGGIIGGF
jgi:hypothetical protein